MDNKSPILLHLVGILSSRFTPQRSNLIFVFGQHVFVVSSKISKLVQQNNRSFPLYVHLVTNVLNVDIHAAEPHSLPNG